MIPASIPSAIQRKLNHRLDKIQALRLKMNAAAAKVNELLGWDVLESRVGQGNMPTDARYLGYCLYLLYGTGGPMYQRITDGVSFHCFTGEDDLPLYGQMMDWEHKFLCDYKEPYEYERPFPQEKAEEVQRYARLYVLSLVPQNTLVNECYALVRRLLFQGPEQFRAVKAWFQANDLRTPNASMGFYLVESEYDKGATSLPFKEDAPPKSEIGTQNVEISEVPAGTFLLSPCGCIYRKMSVAELRQHQITKSGQPLFRCLTETHMPYTRLYVPGPNCREVVSMGRFRYKVGAHGRPIGFAGWSYDKDFTIVAKPKRIKSRAVTKDKYRR